jgi:hypothetical protein
MEEIEELYSLFGEEITSKADAQQAVNYASLGLSQMEDIWNKSPLLQEKATLDQFRNKLYTMPSVFERQENSTIAKIESNGDYKAFNGGGGGDGALGKYQVRYRTHKDKIKEITGVDNKEAFFSSPGAQELYQNYLYENEFVPNLEDMKRLNVENGRNLSDQQLIYTMHHQGISGAKYYMENGKSHPNLMKFNPQATEEINNVLGNEDLFNSTEGRITSAKLLGTTAQGEEIKKEQERAEEELNRLGTAGVKIPDPPQRDGDVQLEGEEFPSTHLMRTETDGEGNWFSFPTLFQDEDGTWVDMSEEAENGDWKSVHEEAKRRGEVIEFGADKESALAYGEGSWKEAGNDEGISMQDIQSGAATVTPIGYSSPKTMLDDKIGGIEDEIKDLEGGGFLDTISDGVGALKDAAIGFFQGKKPLEVFLENATEERAEIKEKQEELNATIDSLPESIGTIDYESTYNQEIRAARDERFEGVSAQEAVMRTNNSMRQHKNRLNAVLNRRFETLNNREKQMAESVMKGGKAIAQGQYKDPDLSDDAVSNGFKAWETSFIEFGAQSKANRETLNKYDNITKGAITAIAKAGDEDKVSPREALTTYLDSVINDKDEVQAALATEYKEKFLKEDEQFLFLGEETVLGGAFNQTQVRGANSIAGVFDTVGNFFREDDKVFSEDDKKLIDELALKTDMGDVMTALVNNPGTKYAGSISENIVDIGNTRLSVRDGVVIEVRRKDGTKVFDLEKVHKNAVKLYEENPDEFTPRKDYRGHAIFAQGMQVMTDMGLIVSSGAVTGSVLAMYGDLYDEALKETGDVLTAASFAGGTSVLIGLTEKLPISLEGKLGRALTASERTIIKNIPKTVTREASKKASKDLLIGVNWGAKAKRVAKAGLKDIPEDVIGEVFQEVVLENAVQSVMAGITGVDDKPLTAQDAEDTTILTVIASLGPSSMKTLAKGGYLETSLGYAAKNIAAFEEVAENYIQNGTTELDKQERRQKVEGKKAILEDINNTDIFLEDIGVTAPKQREKIKKLTMQKVKLGVEKTNSKSDFTRAIIDDKLIQLEKELTDEKVRLYNLDNDAKIRLNEHGEIATEKEIAKEDNPTPETKKSQSSVVSATPKKVVAPKVAATAKGTDTTETGSSDPFSNFTKEEKIEFDTLNTELEKLFDEQEKFSKEEFVAQRDRITNAQENISKVADKRAENTKFNGKTKANATTQSKEAKDKKSPKEVQQTDTGKEITSKPVLETPTKARATVKVGGDTFVKNTDNVWVKADKKGEATVVRTDFTTVSPNKTVDKRYKEGIKDNVDNVNDAPVATHLSKIARENKLSNPIEPTIEVKEDGTFKASDLYTDKEGNPYRISITGKTENGKITSIKSQEIEFDNINQTDLDKLNNENKKNGTQEKSKSDSKETQKGAKSTLSESDKNKEKAIKEKEARAKAVDEVYLKGEVGGVKYQRHPDTQKWHKVKKDGEIYANPAPVNEITSELEKTSIRKSNEVNKKFDAKEKKAKDAAAKSSEKSEALKKAKDRRDKAVDAVEKGKKGTSDFIEKTKERIKELQDKNADLWKIYREGLRKSSNLVDDANKGVEGRVSLFKAMAEEYAEKNGLKKDGKVTQISIKELKDIFDNSPSKGEALDDMFELLLSVIPDTTVLFTIDGNLDRIGAFANNHYAAFTPEGSNRKTIVHELIHVALVSQQRNKGKLSHETKAVMERIQADFEKFKDLSNNSDLYGFKNEREFAAEVVSNPTFAAEVARLEDSENPKKGDNFIKKILKNVIDFVNSINPKVKGVTPTNSGKIIEEYLKDVVAARKFIQSDNAAKEVVKKSGVIEDSIKKLNAEIDTEVAEVEKNLIEKIEADFKSEISKINGDVATKSQQKNKKFTKLKNNPAKMLEYIKAKKLGVKRCN